MSFTEHEMHGLIAGKCVAGDMKVNEELPAYLVRKILELESERDMYRNAEISWEKAMMSAIGEDGTGSVTKAISDLKAERGALATENKVLDSAIGAIADAYETGLKDLLAQEIDTAVNTTTPATDAYAYANQLRAEGVEMFENWLRESANVFDASARAEWADKNRVAADKARDFAANLRKEQHHES